MFRGLLIKSGHFEKQRRKICEIALNPNLISCYTCFVLGFFGFQNNEIRVQVFRVEFCVDVLKMTKVIFP